VLPAIFRPQTGLAFLQGGRHDQVGAITGVNLPIDCGFHGALSWQLTGGAPLSEAD